MSAKYPDPDDFIRALDSAVGVDSDYFTNHSPSLWILRSDELSILALFPYQAYRIGLTEALRKRESIATIPVPSAVAIVVSPSRIDAPDIIKVIVERDGRTIAPIESSLKPTVMSTRVGAKTMLHAGSVTYACSAFDPDATVRVIAVPETGANIEKELPFVDLLMFSPKRVQLSFTLIGQASSGVEQRIGKPDRVDGKRWAYDINGGVVNVFFDDDDHVTTVQPRTFDLRDLTKRKGRGVVDERTVPPASQPAPPRPAASQPVASQQTVLAETPKRPASELMGKRQAEVTRLLSTPSLISNGTWYYDTPKGSLRVVFGDDEVTDIQPRNFDLAAMTEDPAPVAAAPAPAPPKQPSGAVAQCGDGLYVYVSTGSKTCDGHGGVKEWFVKP